MRLPADGGASTAMAALPEALDAQRVGAPKAGTLSGTVRCTDQAADAPQLPTWGRAGTIPERAGAATTDVRCGVIPSRRSR
jgi:hypothetical protein